MSFTHSEADPQTLTQNVRVQYERFPFPPLALGALEQVKPPQADGAFAHWYIHGRLPKRPLRILDAGCGTGFSTLKLAEANPDAEITAVDLSQASLEIARARLTSAGHLHRVKLLRADLQALPKLGTFDYLHSSGVIHHLPDPAAGLKALRSALAAEGVAYLMVYAAYARKEILAVQQILYSLWKNPEDWNEGLMLCRTFFRGLPEGHLLKRHYQRAIAVATEMMGAEAAASDAFLVDTWLQRCEHLWTQPEWFALLSQCGWQPRRWLDEQAWNLADYLPGLPDYLQTLSQTEQLALIDQLRPPQNFALYVTSHFDPTSVAGQQARVRVRSQDIPVPFGFVSLQENLLDNGRGIRLELTEQTRRVWLNIKGQKSWAELNEPGPDLSGFWQQLLDYGFVALKN